MPNRHTGPTPAADRFWPKVEKTDGCWVWTAARNRGGYGVFGPGGRGHTARAHRMAWELTHGPIPAGAYVCHRCDNRLCVRPDHLFLGTSDENMHDMVTKGRQAKGAAVAHRRARAGEEHGMAKLTATQVGSIRERWAGGETTAALAVAFGVSPATISAICHRRRWASVP